MDEALLNHLLSFLTERRRTLFEEVLEERTRHFTVAVEDVYHLHNTSAVMRNCDAFGIQDVHVIEQRSGKRIDREIAMGAQKWVSVHRHKEPTSCIESLRSQGYRIVACSPHKQAYPLKDFSIEQPSVFFFGREVDGLSEEVMDTADDFIYIPMVGFSESLNISVSAAVILQYLTHQLKSSKIDWKLSEEERQELKFKWAKNTLKRSDKIIAHYHKSR
ncbi:TrmH family RNA methyltransferase [Croceiramulus getboli]|nr:RNA methyltransferase [Flavobacteriaceae bacterium YJPT1-3]